MRGVKQCFGVLLALATIFGLSLHVSSDVNALKHNITSMPLYNFNDYEISVNYYKPFSISFDEDPGFNLSQTKAPAFFSPQVGGGICLYNPQYSHLNDPHMIYEDNSLTFYTTHVFALSTNNPSSASNCRRLSGFNKDGAWDLNRQGILPSEVNRFYPYWYNYLKLTYSDSWKDPNTGVVYDSTGLSGYRFIGWDNVHKITNPTKMVIPIGSISDIKSDDFVNIVTGTNIHFYYEVYLTDLSDYDLATSENANYTLHFKGYYRSNMVDNSVSCNKNIQFDDYGLRLQFDCDWTSDHDYGDRIGFYFEITPGTGYNYIWDVTYNSDGGSTDTGNIGGDITFHTESLYVVTDNDSTPGASLGSKAIGSDPSASPGSAEGDFNNGEAEPSWFDSLLNLFTFGFMNPFAPIFNLFNDQNTCVNIPIIAGMLHSEETQVCPWFDSNTRNIVTPVLGLASIMLVFGFAVRWLGSSSGNLFEDSSSEEVSNQGGQWGHFKRGGK